MPDDAHDVYGLLVEQNEEGQPADIVGVIAFGLFWNELDEWMQHRAGVTGRSVSQDEIEAHIREDLSGRYFSELKRKSLQIFGESALEFLKDRIELERNEAVRSSLVSTVETRLADYSSSVLARLAQVEADVNRAASWWRQLGMTLLIAIIVPILLGLILVGIGGYERLLPTPSAIGGSADHK